MLRNERSKTNPEISLQIRKWPSAYFLRFETSFQSILNLKKGALAPFFAFISISTLDFFPSDYRLATSDCREAATTDYRLLTTGYKLKKGAMAPFFVLE